MATASAEVSEWASLPDAARIDWLEKIWRFFCSLRLTITLLILFALGMVAGTFVNPQNAPMSVIEKALASRPIEVEAYRFFQLYDLFHSWWFTLVLVMIALNLVACTIERLPRVALTVLHPERQLTDEMLRGIRSANKLTSTIAATEDELERKVVAVAGAHGFKVHPVETLGGVRYVFAESGWWARFGVWVVHASLLLILAGGLIGRFGGFEGTITLPEGGGEADYVDVKLSDGSVYKKPLENEGRRFSVRCDAFRLKQFKNGDPRAFESDLTVLDGPMAEGGRAPQDGSEKRRTILAQTILVNHPLRYAGLSVYQATYQQDGQHAHASVALKNKATGEVKKFTVGPGEAFTWPGQPGVKYVVEDYDADFSGLGPAVQVLRAEGAKHASFWVFARDADFDARNRGDKYGLQFEKLEPAYATGLQIARDPGVPFVYSGCFMLFFGLFIAFATSHRRLWARIEGGKVTLAGAAHRNAPAFERVFTDLAAELGVTR